MDLNLPPPIYKDCEECGESTYIEDLKEDLCPVCFENWGSVNKPLKANILWNESLDFCIGFSHLERQEFIDMALKQFADFTDIELKEGDYKVNYIEIDKNTAWTLEIVEGTEAIDN